MRKLNIYIFVPACFNRDYKEEEEGKKPDSIKLTSPPFHVRKEVIIVLYTADEARPIMMEGWVEPVLWADTVALSRHCKWRLGTPENWGGCIKKIRINSLRRCSCFTKSPAIQDVLPVCGWVHSQLGGQVLDKIEPQYLLFDQNHNSNRIRTQNIIRELNKGKSISSHPELRQLFLTYTCTRRIKAKVLNSCQAFSVYWWWSCSVRCELWGMMSETAVRQGRDEGACMHEWRSVHLLESGWSAKKGRREEHASVGRTTQSR